MNEHYYLLGLHFGFFEIVEEHIQDIGKVNMLKMFNKC